ncbi:hypothetical protein [Amycolatopsis sp. cg13]|uniref:hypothetical protein n=1 Tax=Amycolatopsis sp. cg13 TaxID=3238807 RepID=UPI003524728C
MSGAALTVSICALVFTVFSFWWLNARPGRLKTFPPHTFASGPERDGRQSILIPLVLHNTGALPIVVRDLRVVVLGEPAMSALRWERTRPRLRGENDADLPATFAVPGRSVTQIFAEFDSAPPGFQNLDREIRVEAQLGRRARWHHVVTFVLHASAAIQPEQYLEYRNEKPSEG